MKKVILITSIIFTQVATAKLSSSWMIDRHVKKDSVSSLDGISDTLNEIVDLNSKKLEQKSSSRGKWELNEFETNLAVGLSGTFGLSLSGKSAVELIWKKRKNRIGEVEKDDADFIIPNNLGAIDSKIYSDELTNSISSMLGIENNNQLSKEISMLIENIKYFDNALDGTSKLAYAPSRIWFDLKVSASGNVYGVTAGGGTRIRFQYDVKPKESTKSLNRKENKIKKLVTLISKDIEHAVLKEGSDKFGYRLAQFKVALGISAKGNIGVAKGEVAFKPHITFKRNENIELKDSKVGSEKFLPIYTMLSTEEMKATYKHANQKKISFKRLSNKSAKFEMSRKKFRKGIKKAIRFGSKLAKKVSKKSKKENKWYIDQIRPVFEIGVGGSIGVASVKASPSIRLRFKKILEE